MPRLSLFRPEKGNDFRFLDRVINEEFQVGGTDVYIHKYVGPQNPESGQSTPTTPNNTNDIPELGIQDLLFMENRDRKYEPDVYIVRGIYTLQDIDFNLSQFGLFLQNDNIMMTFHLRGSVESLGRKIMAGDVIELPHQKDEYALDNNLIALKRFYVITEVSRPASGYSQTWYPHLIRAKCAPLVDSQEFKEILDNTAGENTNDTLRDLLSTYEKNLEINNQIIAQAQEDTGKTGYDTQHLFVIPEKNNLVDTVDTSLTDVDVSTTYLDASIILNTPSKDYYVGYLNGDGVPTNGSPYSFGITFPMNPVNGQFFLRTDYLPNRLFRFDGRNWIKFEDNVRMTNTTKGIGQDPVNYRNSQKAGFINNVNTATIAGEVVVEKQALSKVLKPKADN